MARAASEQEDVFPIHQRDCPSVMMRERTADFEESRPETVEPFSMRRGPAWRSCEELATAVREERRVMEADDEESMR